MIVEYTLQAFPHIMKLATSLMTWNLAPTYNVVKEICITTLNLEKRHETPPPQTWYRNIF